MKFIKNIFLLLIVAVGWVNIGFGQATLPSCPSIGLTDNDVICGKFSENNWDWESSDCKNWNYKVDATVKNLPHPFLSSSQSKRVREISELGDYKKANGWELIQKDFGCYSSFQNANSTRYPFFVLYNKYSSMLRIFVNAPPVIVQNVTYQYMFKLSAENRPSAVTSPSILKAPDRYLNEVISNEEALYYYHPEASGGNWIVGEFNLNFDYNIKNAVYNNSKINIDLLLISSQSIKAKIDGKVVTYDKDDPQFGGVNFSSKTDPTTNTFTAAGKKLTEFGKNGVKDLENLNKDISKLSDDVKKWSISTPSLGKYSTKLNGLTAITDPKYGGLGNPASTFFDAAKSAGGALSVVGDALNIVDFVGDFTGWWNLFEDKKTGPSITRPTISNYDLTFEGNISAQQLQTNIVITIPATVNTVANTTYLSYYNSPVGIYNIQNTLSADRIKYNRYVGWSYYYSATCFGITNNKYTAETKDYNYIKLTNDIIPLVNNCSNKSFIGAQKAIFVKFQTDPLYKSDGFIIDRTYSPICGGAKNTHKTYNPFYYQIANNQLEIVKYDKNNNVYIFRTPYVDYRANNLFIEAPADAEYFVNVLATFSDNTNVPFVLSKNYEIKFNDLPYQTRSYETPKSDDTRNVAFENLGQGLSKYDEQVSNFTSSYLANNQYFPTFFDLAIFDDTDENGSLIKYKTDKEDIYSLGLTYRSNNISVNNVSNLVNKNLVAGTSIEVLNSSLSNCELKIENEFVNSVMSLGINSSLNPIYSQFVCDSYNSRSQRISDLSNEFESSATFVYPNPFKDNLSLNLSDFVNEKVNIVIFDILGNKVLEKEILVNDKILELNTTSFQSGLFIVKFESELLNKSFKVLKID